MVVMEHKEHWRIFSNVGKGDKRRPTQVDHETYSDNYDRIFKKKKEEKEIGGRKFLLNLQDMVTGKSSTMYRFLINRRTLL